MPNRLQKQHLFAILNIFIAQMILFYTITEKNTTAFAENSTYAFLHPGGVCNRVFSIWFLWGIIARKFEIHKIWAKFLKGHKRFLPRFTNSLHFVTDDRTQFLPKVYIKVTIVKSCGKWNPHRKWVFNTFHRVFHRK